MNPKKIIIIKKFFEGDIYQNLKSTIIEAWKGRSTLFGGTGENKRKNEITKQLEQATGTNGGRLNTAALGGLKSGITLVGERGPEIVDLPNNSMVHSNQNSKKMVGGSTNVTNNITVNVKGSMGVTDAEVRALALKVGQMISKEINRTTNLARF